MPRFPSLWIDDAPASALGMSSAAFYDAVVRDPAIVASARALARRGATAPRVGGPSVYVFQKEIATVPRHSPLVLGSDRATTCHVLIACSPTRAVCAHLDGSDGQTVACVERLRTTFGGEAADLHLAGGFMDDRGISTELGRELLWALNDVPGIRLNLKTACIGPLNSATVRVPRRGGVVETAAPRVRALAVDVPTGDVIPNAWFDALGPHGDHRGAYSAFGIRPLVSVTDPDTGAYRIDRELPFQWMDRRMLRSWLDLDDADMLEMLSTSPLVEHDTFCEEMRANLRYLLNH